ncbi:MAG: 1-acyl-sn-glycerol-3-phosphate acyltransferase [Rhodobacter sp.]|uniref:1-acyl-sn-glycerol-3-phosphate acyltransferase n=1 Tax=Pararhodobacter sp. TaxID=2127056 RepID=UPI001E0E5E9B|nr:1-acyl-sn-glycerol-3-phosphate acyltransferase [Pararhodobacter sp.]MCB1346290.1 1-acyl-sn-glycerol-3-phosphate acyltransferase [Paracoccaceae bacterium]MCC0073003.1 1-acyl-sn-glycerol-3-phosphate acyltransferase [Rhodobacter sp.]HPD93817.1 1-acyl-sn-glycerol-3-phosphate acyltransferase [Pararhodobacter sp.]
MLSPIPVPLWLLILILLFAGASFLSHFLFPSVRWFFRRRMERAVEELNKRLERPIQPFKLVRRQDYVVRLVYDPQVMEAVADFAREQGIPRSVAFEKARRYAREIVPGFSTAAYFGFAIRVARRLSRMFYSVHLGAGDAQTLRAIDPRSAVVFVINHRSNMDYVLVTWLAADRSALSYAVGEWAQVWPLRALIRAMGAYYIRRRDSNPLYRAVLARYVQMSVHEGVTQAIFPEGGLSLSGAVGPAKKGLLHYIVRDFRPSDSRDVVFVPVALNYDRVLEDRILHKAAITGERRFRVRLTEAAGWVLRLMWQKARGRFRTFGNAAVCYGAPVSLRDFLTTQPGASTEALADLLMTRVRAAVPVLPVPLAAAALVRAGGASSLEALRPLTARLVDDARAQGATLHLPGGVNAALHTGLAALVHRGLVLRDEDALRIAPGQEGIVGYYAASAIQRLAEPDLPGGYCQTALELPEVTET